MINVRKITPIGKDNRKYSQLGKTGLYLATGYIHTPKNIIYKNMLRYFFVLSLNASLSIRRFFIMYVWKVNTDKKTVINIIKLMGKLYIVKINRYLTKNKIYIK